MLAAQKADHEEMEAFRGLLPRTGAAGRGPAVRTRAATPSSVSRAELEKLYEQACGLPEDHEQEKQALSKLIGLIMKAVRQSAGNDPLAHRELEEEEQARAIHFRLLEQPLLADILHPESPIGVEELVPSLLSAGEQELQAVLEVFDSDQLGLLAAQGRELLAALDREGVATSIPRQGLALIEKGLSA